MSQALTPLLAFIGVVAMIPVVLWLVRRAGGVRAGPRGLLNMVDALAVSPSQRVVVVALQQGPVQRWLVLGVGAESITPIATLDAPPSTPLDVHYPQAPTVAQMISRWRGEPSTGGPHAG